MNTSVVQFGKHKGVSVLSLIEQYPQYVDWLFKVKNDNNASQHVLSLCDDIDKLIAKIQPNHKGAHCMSDAESTEAINKYTHADILSTNDVETRACTLEQYADSMSLSLNEIDLLKGLPTDSLVMYSTKSYGDSTIHGVTKVFGRDGSVIMGASHGN